MQPGVVQQVPATVEAQASINQRLETVPAETQSLLNESRIHRPGEHIITGLGTFPSPSDGTPSTCVHISRSVASPDPPRSLTFVNGLALVIGLQIGSGIFSSPSAIFTGVGSAGPALIIWLLAGILAWTGAASFTELGSIVPLNGGVQEYLRYCYNDTCGFLGAWTWVLVVKPCSTAMLSLTFSEYLNRALAFEELPSIWVLRGTAWITVIFITYLNCIGTRVSADTANIFLVLKLTGVGSIIITGLALLAFRHGPKMPGIPEHDGKDMNSGLWGHLGAYTDATLAALWAYSGWEALGLVAGELKNPTRNLPRVLNSAMVIVITLFILTNIAYFIALPLEVLRGTNTIALDFGRIVFGRAGMLFYAWIVCLSCLGGLNVKIFTAGRMTEAAVQRRYLPRFLATFHVPSSFARVQESSGEDESTFSIFIKRMFFLRKSPSVPINAMLLNLCLTSIYLLLGTFRSLLIFVGMAESVTLFAAVAGVLVLRSRAHVDTDPPTHRTWALNPIIYCTVIAAVFVRSAVKHPIEGIVIVIFNLVGTGVYKLRSLQRSVRIENGLD